MNRILKILGKRGRITIPFGIRSRHRLAANDVLSFEDRDQEIVIRKIKLCDGCRAEKESSDSENEISLTDFLDGLSIEEQRTALIHLSIKWAQTRETAEKKKDGGTLYE